MNNLPAKKLALGTMTIGMQLFGEAGADFVSTALRSGISMIDTAYVYNGGKSELLLGSYLHEHSRNTYRIALKANPRPTGNLSRETVRNQFTESLNRLGLEHADVFYMHFPNHATPIEETLAAFTELFEQGMYDSFGISNCPLELVEAILNLAETQGFVKPSVYQGVYNLLSRKVETRLYPLLKHEEIAFTAYNPLAGGLLTGKYASKDRPPEEGRFVKMVGYRDRYWLPGMFSGMDHLRSACEKVGISMAEASYRWLLCHSALADREADSLIIGASSSEQLKSNLNSAAKGPLPDEIIAAAEEAWELSRKDAPDYGRYIG